jgi:hypothetical protein
LQRDYEDLPGVSVCLEGDLKTLEGEWEDGERFSYTASDFKTVAMRFRRN